MSVSKPAHIMRELLRNYKTTRKLPKNLERCLVIVGFLLGVLLVFKFISSKSGKGGTAFRRRDKIAIVVLTSYRIDHTKRVIDGIRHMDPKADYTIAYRDSNAPDILKKITRERFDYVRDVPAFLHKNQRGNDYYRPTQSPLRTTWLYVMTDLWSRFLDLNEVCYFEDDIFPHPQFLKILREVRQTARGRLETSAQNEKKRQTCQTCLTGDLKDGGVALENGMCRDYCSRNGFCGSNANYRNRGTDCTFLKTNTVPRVWSFKGRVGQGLTSVNALRESMNADYSMAVPLCITFQEYSLFIQNVADDYCLQSGGGMNAWDIALMTAQQQDLLPPKRYITKEVVAIHLKGHDWDNHEASIQALLQTSPSSTTLTVTPMYAGKMDPDPWVDLSTLTKNDFENPGGWPMNRPPLRQYINTIGTCFRLMHNTANNNNNVIG